MRKPSLALCCVANSYAADGERIAEFSFPAAATDAGALPGGLLSLRYRDGKPPLVSLYRVEGCETVQPDCTPYLRSLLSQASEYVERFADLNGEPTGGDCRTLLALLIHEGWPAEAKRQESATTKTEV